jgi:hypothetical protein
MIRYKLACPKSHEFEVWFPSSDACEAQIARKLVACPTCGSTKVSKALMAPSVVTSERKAKRPARKSRQPAAASAGEPQAPTANTVAAQMLSGPQREMLQQLREMRDKILADTEYVGPRFAEEARKIHSEEAPGRGIYGEATAEEVKELTSEGIDVFPVPVLPEDHN